jgi:hypothetical protein
MKMKKIFKLLMCAAIVAAGFTACSEEVTPIPEPGPDVVPVNEGVPTNATISFSIPDAGTKALTPDGTETETLDSYRILIFDNATGKLEVDTAKTIAANDTIVTIQLISGTKRIYVTANTQENGRTTLTTPNKGVAPFNYTDGNVAQINGVSRLTSTLESSAPYSDLDSLHMLYKDGKFFYSSTVNEAVHTIQPGITGPQSVAGPTNRLYIPLERPVAKVAVRQTAGSSNFATIDGKGTIDVNSIQYKMWSVNARMYPFQNYAAGTVLTPEYIPTMEVDANTVKYYAREQGLTSANNFIPIKYSTTATTLKESSSSNNRFYYVSENNPSQKKRGNTTIANVEAIYLPKATTYLAVAPTYNNVTKVYTTVTPAAVDLATATDMYLLLGAYHGLDKVLIAGSSSENIAKKIYYHIKNPDAADKPAVADYASLVDLGIAVTKADFDLYFDKYTAGKAYYRLDIGQQTGTGVTSLIDNVVRRNYYYECNITGFLELGRNSPAELVEPEDEDLRGLTNLSVTITLRDWTGKSIETPI